MSFTTVQVVVPAAFETVRVSLPQGIETVVAGALPDLEAGLNSQINVREFGVLGNGITDDTAALQSAVDTAGSLLAKTHKVYIPRGFKCRITAPLKLPRGVTLLGNYCVRQGSSNYAAIVPEAEESAIVYDGAVVEAMLEGADPSNTDLSGLVIEGLALYGNDKCNYIFRDREGAIGWGDTANGWVNSNTNRRTNHWVKIHRNKMSNTLKGGVQFSDAGFGIEVTYNYATNVGPNIGYGANPSDGFGFYFAKNKTFYRPTFDPTSPSYNPSTTVRTNGANADTGAMVHGNYIGGSARGICVDGQSQYCKYTYNFMEFCGEAMLIRNSLLTDISGCKFEGNRDGGARCLSGGFLEIGVFKHPTAGNNATTSEYTVSIDGDGNIVTTNNVTAAQVNAERAFLTDAGEAIRLSSSNPVITFSETDQAAPNGRYRLQVSGGEFSVRRNTAAGNDFSTAHRALRINSQGSTIFDTTGVPRQASSPYAVVIRNADTYDNVVGPYGGLLKIEATHPTYNGGTLVEINLGTTDTSLGNNEQLALTNYAGGSTELLLVAQTPTQTSSPDALIRNKGKFVVGVQPSSTSPYFYINERRADNLGFFNDLLRLYERDDVVNEGVMRLFGKGIIIDPAFDANGDQIDSDVYIDLTPSAANRKTYFQLRDFAGNDWLMQHTNGTNNLDFNYNGVTVARIWEEGYVSSFLRTDQTQGRYYFGNLGGRFLGFDGNGYSFNGGQTVSIINSGVNAALNLTNTTPTTGKNWRINSDDTGRLVFFDQTASTVRGSFAANGQLSLNAGLNIIAGGLQINGRDSHFESAPLSVSANSFQVTVNHDNVVAPDTYKAVLRCVTAEHGYAVGDEIEIQGIGTDSSVSLWASASQLGLVYQRTGNMLINHKSTFAAVSITNANWRIIFKAIWL